MSQEFAFQMPQKNQALVAELVEAVPDDWSYCNGHIVAPLESAANNLVAGAGYVINNASQFAKIEIATPFDRESIREPADMELRMERRERIAQLLSGVLLPSFVQFDIYCEGEFGMLPFHSIKTVIQSYVSRGYTGDLTFEHHVSRDDETDASIEMHTENWRELYPRPGAESRLEYIDGKPVFETPRREHPPLIKLSSTQEVPSFQSVLSICRTEKLTQLDPFDIGFGQSLSRTNI